MANFVLDLAVAVWVVAGMFDSRQSFASFQGETVIGLTNALHALAASRAAARQWPFTGDHGFA